MNHMSWGGEEEEGDAHRVFQKNVRCNAPGSKCEARNYICEPWSQGQEPYRKIFLKCPEICQKYTLFHLVRMSDSDVIQNHRIHFPICQTIPLFSHSFTNYDICLRPIQRHKITFHLLPVSKVSKTMKAAVHSRRASHTRVLLRHWRPNGHLA
jgi:hypothetical protein